MRHTPRGPVVMLLADRLTAAQTIGQWRPGHLSERVVTQTLLRTFVAHHEAAKREVKHILLKKKKRKIQAEIWNAEFLQPLTHILMNLITFLNTIFTVKRIFWEINITDLPGTFICASRYFSKLLLKHDGSLPVREHNSINILFIEKHVLKGPLTIKATFGVSCSMN